MDGEPVLCFDCHRRNAILNIVLLFFPWQPGLFNKINGAGFVSDNLEQVLQFLILLLFPCYRFQDKFSKASLVLYNYPKFFWNILCGQSILFRIISISNFLWFPLLHYIKFVLWFSQEVFSFRWTLNQNSYLIKTHNHHPWFHLKFWLFCYIFDG